MRISVVTGLLACAAVAALSSQTANAQTSEALSTSSLPAASLTDDMQSLVDTENDNKSGEKKPSTHKVKPNENLSTIAKQHKTDWKRLYNKNVHIEDPNVIAVEEKIVVPLPDEKLKNRPLPEPEPAPIAKPTAETKTTRASNESNTTVQSKSKPSRSAAVKQRPVAYRGSVAGNTYTAGYCTWYAKNRRADLPNNLGNANTWVSRAAAQGIPTGSTPRAGAIGQQGMHVVYVERVNSNGTVYISEMNYKGLYVKSTRTVPASYFTYIY